MAKLQRIRPNCAGVDVCSSRILIGIEDKPVRSFDTCTNSLRQAVTYLMESGITELAMEDTGSIGPLFLTCLGQRA